MFIKPLNHLKLYWKSMLISLLLTIIVQGIALVPPYVMSYTIDEAIPSGNMNLILRSILLFVAIPCISGLLYSLYIYYTATCCRKFAYRINQSILAALMTQDMSFFDSNPGAELAAKTSQDANDYVYLWICTIPQTLGALITTLISLMLIARMSWIITVTQLIYVLLLLLPAQMLGKVVKDNSSQIFTAVVKIRTMLVETFQGIRYIKTMCLENNIISEYRKLFLGANSIFGRSVVLESILHTNIREFLSSLFLGIGFVTCTIFVINGQFTMGMLVACLSLLPRYYQGVGACTGANLAFMKQIGQFEELFKYMELRKPTKGTEEPQKFLQQSLDLKDIRFTYNDRVAVFENFNLCIQPGKWFGIEGESGKGKSTLLHLILQLYQPDSGAIYMDGHKVDELDITWYRSNIAFVDQTPFLFNSSIYDNFKLVRNCTNEEDMWKALELTCLEKKVQELPEGIHSQVGENGVAFSGGEKQRLALAIALSTNRPLLVLDEATSHLNEELDERIMNNLRALVDQGMTIISSSHRKKFHKLCDKIIKL